jgi:hypothetical protein
MVVIQTYRLNYRKTSIIVYTIFNQMADGVFMKTRVIGRLYNDDEKNKKEFPIIKQTTSPILPTVIGCLS